MAFQSTGYIPTQYDNPLNQGQDPDTFYEALLDPSGVPSQLFCRMSDACFFFLDNICPINTRSGYIETEKLLWRSIAVGEKTDMAVASLVDFSPLYISTSIPHSLDANRRPLLDRRGFLHVLVFEIQIDPEDAYKEWNRVLNIHKLVDPLTGLYLPTPIPRSAFPSQRDERLHAIHEKWQNDVITKIQTAKQTQPQTASASASAFAPASATAQFQEYQEALREQERTVLRSQLLAARHLRSTRAINNII